MDRRKLLSLTRKDCGSELKVVTGQKLVPSDEARSSGLFLGRFLPLGHHRGRKKAHQLEKPRRQGSFGLSRWHRHHRQLHRIL